MSLPKYLCDKDGNPREPPAGLRHVFRCWCGERLTWAGNYWVCPAKFHSKGKTHHRLIEELRELMARGEYGRCTPEGIFHVQRRIDSHRRRQAHLDHQAGLLRRRLEEEGASVEQGA